MTPIYVSRSGDDFSKYTTASVARIRKSSAEDSSKTAAVYMGYFVND